MNAIWCLIPLLLSVQEASQEEIERWIEQLDGDFEDERTQAFQNLEKAGAKAEEALAEALSSPSPRVRGGCLELLTRLSSLKVVEPASDLFQRDPDQVVRQKAFAYLQKAGAAAEDPLIRILDHHDAKFREGALESLMTMKSQKCAGKVAELFDREAPGRIKDRAFECLKYIGAAAKPHLLRLLESKESTVRLGALEGLEKIETGDDDILEAVTKMFLAEPVTEVQQKAFENLRKRGRRAEASFLSGLGSALEPVRIHSVGGLEELKSEKGLTGVADLFDRDSSEAVKKKALEFLVALGTKSEERLLASLERDDPKVRLLAIEGLGRIGSPKPLSKIAKMYREDSDKEVHRTAFGYLLRVGPAAEDDLLYALEKEESREAKKEAVEALGRAGSRKAIDPLLQLLSAGDGDLRDAARDALVRIGPEAVDAAARAVKEGKIPEKAGEQIAILALQERVERALDSLITEQGNTGCFEGQFQPVKAMGDRVGGVLAKMFEPEYQPRIQRKEAVGNYVDRMRRLAILALGELGDASALPAVKERWKSVYSASGDPECCELAVTAFRLGDKEPFETFVRDQRKVAEEEQKAESQNYDPLFRVGMVQSRVGDLEGACTTYENLRQMMESGKATETSRYPEVLYNLSCSLARSGKKDEAIRVLEQSVRAGFCDRDWIRMDGDLKSLAGEEAFRALLANDALFQDRK